MDADALAGARARSLETAARWRDGAAHARVADAFAGLPLDDAGPATRAARALLADTGWLDPLLAPLIAAQMADPLAEPPLRASRDGLRTGAVLHDAPAATLTLTVLSAAALGAAPPARTVVVPGRVSVVRYLRGGGATLRLWHAERAGPGFTAAGARACHSLGRVALTDGLLLRHDGRIRGGIIRDARRDVVTLTATIRAGADPLMREYRLDTGALHRLAATDERASRAEMLLTFLRHAGRADAAPRFEAASRDPAFFLRWAAMREWLALDVAAARPRLAEMAAGDPHPEVRAAARATLPLAEARCHA